MYLYDRRTNRWCKHAETREFRKRKRIIKYLWIVSGLLMLVLPLGGQIILALLITFISFAFLDEKPYQQPSTQEDNQDSL